MGEFAKTTIFCVLNFNIQSAPEGMNQGTGYHPDFSFERQVDGPARSD
jgi:hypothetical protein